MATSKGKQKVIDATLRILQSHSIKEISMRNIAKEAGVTTGSIYHHYKNKDELIIDVMEHSLYFTPKLYESMRSEGFQKRGPELLDLVNFEVSERIKKVEQQELHIQFFSHVMKTNMEIQDAYKKNYKNILESTSKLLLEAYEIEESPVNDTLASILVAAIDGIALQQTMNILPDDLDGFIDTFTDFFTKSLGSYLHNKK